MASLIARSRPPNRTTAVADGRRRASWLPVSGNVTWSDVDSGLTVSVVLQRENG